MKLVATLVSAGFVTLDQLPKENFSCAHCNPLTLTVVSYEYIGTQPMIQKVFLLISFPVKFQGCKNRLQTLGSFSVSSEDAELSY